MSELLPKKICLTSIQICRNGEMYGGWEEPVFSGRPEYILASVLEDLHAENETLRKNIETLRGDIDELLLSRHKESK